MDIEEVLNLNREKLMELHGVQGVGLGLNNEDEPVILLMLEQIDPAYLDSYPRQLQGHSVLTEAVGTIHAC